MTILISLFAIAFLEPYQAKVVAVHDGDTITVRTDKTIKIRLEGIDAPELKQSHGQASKQALSELVFGKQITVKPKEIDRYGRTVARLETNRIDVNLRLVEQGSAWWYERYAKHDTGLEAAQTKARSEKIGLWADPNAIPPWEYRKRKAKK